MIWHLSHRADPEARVLADRHYTRQHVGASGFVPPGRCIVLKAPSALWVSSWPFAEYVHHMWPGAWICTMFRNEDPQRYLSSTLIQEAVAATRFIWGGVPDLGMITFVNPTKVRRKRDWGRCFLRAGFVPATPRETKGGLIALQLLPNDMPAPAMPWGMQLSLDSIGTGQLPR